MSFKVRVNNEPFLSFESGSLTRSIDENTGLWSLTSSTQPNINFPIKVGDYVQILINDIVKSTGYVDEIQIKEDATSHTITAAGRDNIQDIIDSSIPDENNVKVNEGPISLKALCQRVLNALNSDIKVINEVPDIAEFTMDDLQAAESGCKAMEFLTSFARKRQVYLNSDGQGNLLIFRPLKQKATTKILHEKNGVANNVLSYELRVAQNEMYYKYACKSQDNVGYDDNSDYAEDGMSRAGIAIDNTIRKSRYLEFQAEETMKDNDCKKRAAEMANLKRARQNEYKCTIQGFAQNDGTLWDIGQQVSVKSDFAGVNGEMVIKEIKYNIDLSGGSLCNFNLVSIDAYQVIAEQPKQDTRKSSLAMEFKRDINDPEYIDSWRTRKTRYNRTT
jgi:prophage tail gpP-like protein